MAQLTSRSLVSSSVALGKMNRYSEKITQSKSQGASQVSVSLQFALRCQGTDLLPELGQG